MSSPASALLWCHSTLTFVSLSRVGGGKEGTYSDLVTTVDSYRPGGLDVGNVALHSLGGNILNGVVVRRRVDVSALNISETLGLSVDFDAVNGGVGSGELGNSRESENGGLHFECEFGGLIDSIECLFVRVKIDWLK
jgi:hypothetical protein